VVRPAAEVGSHTRGHPNLTLPSDRDREVAGAKLALEEMIDRPVASFAYPNGYYDRAAIAAAERAGYRGACTTEPGIVVAGGSPFEVPRYGAPDLDGDAFARWLRELG